MVRPRMSMRFAIYTSLVVSRDGKVAVFRDLATPEHRDELVLTEGGVYDNLGLETAWKRCKTVLVSDGGGQMPAEDDPDRDWPRHMIRVLKVIDNQVRALRKRQLIESLKRKQRDGFYLGIGSDVADCQLADHPARPLMPTPFVWLRFRPGSRSSSQSTSDA